MLLPPEYWNAYYFPTADSEYSEDDPMEFYQSLHLPSDHSCFKPLRERYLGRSYHESHGIFNGNVHIYINKSITPLLKNVTLDMEAHYDVDDSHRKVEPTFLLRLNGTTDDILLLKLTL